MLVVLKPGLSDREAISAIARAGGAVVEPVGGTSFLWTVVGDQEGFVGRLRAEGALMALRNVPIVTMVIGCVQNAFAARPDRPLL